MAWCKGTDYIYIYTCICFLKAGMNASRPPQGNVMSRHELENRRAPSLTVGTVLCDFVIGSGGRTPSPDRRHERHG